jgi:DNA polymerase III subunit alpha
MLEAFPGSQQAIQTSLEVAGRCNLEMEFGKFQFPVYRAPADRPLDEYLRELAERGLEERLAVLASRDPSLVCERYVERLQTELDTIRTMGFAGYFLIVADFVNHAKSVGVPVGPGRGSAAGSLVSYALRITDIDPIRYKLLFERFLNPERVTMPDIDVDFCYVRRDEVLQYVREKYGQDRVANIITFGTLKGKAAIRDVGRALDFSFAETDHICKLYPAPKQGKDFSLAQALEMEPRLREVRETGERERKLFEYALKLEGLARHVSKHAAGIVISDKPLVEYVPLFVDKDGTVMTQFSGPDIEAIGLIKFDFLGLKTLTQLADAVRRIKEDIGEDIDLADLPLDDRATYRMLAGADTVGIFQMESGGMRKLLTQIKPSTFEDLVAVLALFRPGPLDSGMVEEYIKRKDGRQQVRYPDQALREILAETYGVIVYQEQVMQIAQVYGGYSLGEADNLRRAMGKKKAEAMARERERFLSGAVAKGRDRAAAESIFQQMETFAAYGFNKSHSAAYALISYQTAYLKAHYPHEFFASLLTLEMGDTDKVYKNLADCRQHGIRVMPPDVNTSRNDFTACEEGIRFGLGAVKGIGEKAVEAIREARDTEGPFRSLGDFCLRTGGQQVNRRIIEGLVASGAFDSVHPSRRRLFDGIEASMAWATRAHEDRAAGQMGLFGGESGSSVPEPPLPDVPDWNDLTRLEHEHEAVGFYISGHPLDRYLRDLELLGVTATQALGSMRDQEVVALAGVTNTVRRKNSRKGERYATFNLEDREGVVEVIAWPDTYKLCEAAIVGRDPVFVHGRLELGEHRRAVPNAGDDDGEAAVGYAMKPQIIADEIVSLTHKRRTRARTMRMSLSSGEHDPAVLMRLRDALQRFPGPCATLVRVLRDGETETVLYPELAVDPTDDLLRALDELLGPGRTTLSCEDERHT